MEKSFSKRIENRGMPCNSLYETYTFSVLISGPKLLVFFVRFSFRVMSIPMSDFEDTSQLK